MSDEEIIKSRLVIDGDATGDDRRLNIMLKQFFKWSYSKNESQDNNHLIYDRLMAQLAQCKFAAAKSYLSEKMIEEESENYQKVSQSILKSIEVAQAEIERSKEELANAKQTRRHKMEYGLLAKVINEQPDRDVTTKKIVSLTKELQDLKEKKASFERKLQRRARDFELLAYALQEMQSNFDNDDSDDRSEIDIDNELLELSDDDTPKTSKKLNPMEFGELKEEVSSDIGEIPVVAASFPLAKEQMIIDEDAVLELSVEKEDVADAIVKMIQAD